MIDRYGIIYTCIHTIPDNFSIPVGLWVSHLIIHRSKTADSIFVCETSIEHHCNRYSTALVLRTLWTVDTEPWTQRYTVDPKHGVRCEFTLGQSPRLAVLFCPRVSDDYTQCDNRYVSLYMGENGQ